MVTRRKKGFSASRSKYTSRRLRTATIGSHVPRSPGRMNGQSVGFSSARKSKRAARGFVDTIVPETASGESGSQYSKRVSRREFTQAIQRRARLRRIIVVVVCCVAVAVIAACAGIFAFLGSIDAKLSLKDSDAASALVAPKESGTFFTVVAADLDPEGVANATAGPDAICLVRVDTQTRAATIVSIPANTQVTLKDGNMHQLREAATQEGDAALVRAVSGLMGVDISHYVKVDAAGIVRLVDSLGGVEVDVAEEVDDPTAGDVYVPAGVQNLDGAAALTLARASNFTDGAEVQADNQRKLLTQVSLRMLGNDTLGFLMGLDGMGDTFQTDMAVADAVALSDALRTMSADSVFGAMLPGYDLIKNDVMYYATSSDEIAAMMELVQAGENPVSQGSVETVDPSSFTITVRNGSGVTGSAAQIAEVLQGKGFKVTETGNTDSFAYNETLVVYKDDAFLPAAQTVVSALEAGRTVAGGDFYTFETDVLVILGQDWKPIA